jgi:acylaminoacyl-peptidase
MVRGGGLVTCGPPLAPPPPLLPCAAALLAKLASVSPLSRLDSLTGPLLLLVGGRDKRVPPTQGVEAYYRLRQRGVPVRLLLYAEDGHPLDKPVTEGDCWTHMVAWFRAFL